MNAFAAAGGGFLLAVLWFDLMFDVQTRRHAGETLPAEILASISAYYRRVTTDANPMGRLIALVMLLTLSALGSEIAGGAYPAWIVWPSLASAMAGIGLALARTVRNAVRLGGAQDPPHMQARLARTIYRDHLFCFAAMALMVGLQLAATS
ncbi:MAG TPA: hypothetical protein VII56_11610 [Rhizomicrobium sp.]